MTDEHETPPPKRTRGRPPGARDRGPRVAGGAKAAARAAQSGTDAPPPLAEVAADERDAKRRKGREKSFLRSPHGRAVTHGNPGPRVEVPPADELSYVDSSHAKQIAERAPLAKGKRGAFLPGESASTAGRAGGLAKKGAIAFGASLGLSTSIVAQAPEEAQKMLRRAASYRRVRTAELALLGGGVCGVDASAMVAAAARDLASSAFVFQVALTEKDTMKQAKLFAMASKIGQNAKQHQIAAYELAVREAKARSGGKPADPLGGFTARPALEAGESNYSDGAAEPQDGNANSDVTSIRAEGSDPNSVAGVIRTEDAPPSAVTVTPERRG